MSFAVQNLKMWTFIVLVSGLVSFVTSYSVLYMTKQQVEQPSAIGFAPQQAAQPKIDCGQQVYSPVQNKCVSQDIFDEEMTTLFSALGIDISIYQSKAAGNQ